jgi:hypothetical protein
MATKSKKLVRLETGPHEQALAPAINGLIELVREDLLRSFAAVKQRQKEIRKNVEETKVSVRQGARAPGRRFSL